METVLPRLTTVTTPPPTAPTSPRPALPARPSPGCANPTGSQEPGTSDVSIVSRGERRSYLRTIPIGLDSAPAPLVVVLDDGSGEPGAFIDRARWGAMARERSFIIAAPRWTRADDDRFAADAIVDIERGTCVDLARVYLAGFATGAALGTRVVCEHPGLVTAFVAVAGLLAPDRCAPDDRVPVLVVEGALDEVASPSSVGGAARAWARQDRCHPEPVSELAAWNSVYYEFERCEAAVDVELYLVSDMGHEWPEALDDLSEARRWADLMSTTTIASEFFDRYAR